MKKLSLTRCESLGKVVVREATQDIKGGKSNPSSSPLGMVVLND